MIKRNDVKLVIIMMLGDILAVNLGFLFSYWLRFGSGMFPVVYGTPHISEYFKLLPLISVILIFLMRSDKLYSVRARLSIVDEFFTIVRSVTVGVLLFMAGTFLYREFSFSRGMLIISWFMLILFVGGWRFIVNRARFSVRRRGENLRNLLIIGDGGMAERLIKHISGDPHWDYRVKGILAARGRNGKDCEAPVLGELTDLAKVISEHDIEEVILTDAELPRSEVMNIILECEKRMVEFRLVADLLGMVTSQVDMRTIDGIPFLGLKESPLAEGYNRFLKRSLDVILSGLGLLVISPMLLLVSAGIKLTSPGSVFYFQKRVGEDGERFTMLKFRTMVSNAEKGVGISMTAENDPRKTAFGNFLRRWNLDELPQLLNVLRGDMSLVGPRPERPHFVRGFREDIPRYMARHKIKPGMTGWAQVNGLRGNTSKEERTKYDLYYIENWSLAFDLKILFMSIFAFKNAY